MFARKVQRTLDEASRVTAVSPERRGQTISDKPTVVKVNFDQSLDGSPKAPTSNVQLAEALIQSSVFKEYQRSFQELTGLPLTLLAAGDWKLAHNGNRRQNGFCALMSRQSQSCAACLRAQQRVRNGVNRVPCTLSCAFGLFETAVGVKIGQDIIAYLQTGQVFFWQSPTEFRQHLPSVSVQ